MLNPTQIATGIARLFSRAVASRRIHAAALAAVLCFGLVACGGGGSSNRSTSGSGVAVPASALQVSTAPDPYYRAGCDTPRAGCYGGNIKDFGNSIYGNGISTGVRRIQSAPGNQTLRMINAPQDVSDALRAGWTGRGVDILLIDEFRGDSTHGYGSRLSTQEIARFAGFWWMEAGAEDGLRSIADTNYKVINVYSEAGLTDLLRGDLSGAADARLNNAADAVITKWAGNNAADANTVADNRWLIENTMNRALVVGALSSYARTTPAGSTYPENSNVSMAAVMAGNSNRAGASAAMQSRFLVEYGGLPLRSDVALVCTDNNTADRCGGRQSITLRSGGVGTSFAAPRVAGYATLVRHKFPNLTGAQTAEILLDTATTAGLACHTGEARKSPDCPRNIYGQGRVNITDALSPSGKLD